jgi:hypothetical protein
MVACSTDRDQLRKVTSGRFRGDCILPDKFPSCGIRSNGEPCRISNGVPAIKSMPPNKLRGVARVNDHHVLNGIFWMLRSGVPIHSTKMRGGRNDDRRALRHSRTFVATAYAALGGTPSVSLKKVTVRPQARSAAALS